MTTGDFIRSVRSLHKHALYDLAATLFGNRAKEQVAQSDFHVGIPGNRVSKNDQPVIVNLDLWKEVGDT
jgi:hypothetical protein